ncbi:hypothetical protein Mapa_007626 [Marchantia paleacea]|nr:hypothetical protein Mapa_007626 [Marchantia paleacea]
MSLKDCDSEDATIIKPRSDRRSYRRVVLPNDLQVLLISDPETDKGAGSMDVHAGSFSDPKEFPGLAHILEHMLFFSNEKYPEEGSFRRFIIEHGGSENAYTDAEHTNYHFEVCADHFVEALARFAEFFISPLFATDATSREIKAVDSENSKNLKSDSWRWCQLEKHLTSKDHPYNRFGCGNLETLEVRPKASGIDIRAEVLKFYETYYSSNLMCLAVYGKETLDELQILVEDKLSAVKNSKKNAMYFPGQPCSSEHLQILVKSVPIMEGHALKLIWPITPGLQNYRKASSRYLSHLIDHRAHGSLVALLKKLGWANNLWAWERSVTIQDAAFFNVQVQLTDVGQIHMQEIVDFIFQYLKILRNEGIAEWIFEEIQALSNMKFHFRGKISPDD